MKCVGIIYITILCFKVHINHNSDPHRLKYAEYFLLNFKTDPQKENHDCYYILSNIYLTNWEDEGRTQGIFGKENLKSFVNSFSRSPPNLFFNSSWKNLHYCPLPFAIIEYLYPELTWFQYKLHGYIIIGTRGQPDGEQISSRAYRVIIYLLTSTNFSKTKKGTNAIQIFVVLEYYCFKVNKKAKEVLAS